jgi:hypothetical protein
MNLRGSLVGIIKVEWNSAAALVMLDRFSDLRWIVCGSDWTTQFTSGDYLRSLSKAFRPSDRLHR